MLDGADELSPTPVGRLEGLKFARSDESPCGFHPPYKVARMGSEALISS
jgi:hypothetical protein